MRLKLEDYDRKAKKHITISEASKKLSAIIFMDVSQEHKNKDNFVWVYMNPNADNKVDRSYFSVFSTMKYIPEDFEDDNY